MEDPRYIARRIARENQLLHEQKRKLAHMKVAELLLSDSERGSVVEYANLQIRKWQEKKLCSLDYIQEWSELLSSPLLAAQVLREDSPRAMRLRQNTPFAAYLAK